MLHFLLAAALVAGGDRSALATEADARLAAIGWRLATRNVALCDRTAPLPGWALHALDQYTALPLPAGQSAAQFPTPVAVMLVVPGAPAARAGVRADEGLVAIAGKPVPVPPATAPKSSATRDSVEAAVAAQPADRPLAVTLVERSARRDVTIPASPGCRATFEVIGDGGLGAESDGQMVRLGAALFARYRDDELAVVAAHELAHNILRHRERLQAAGVKFGLLSEFGRNARLFQRTETEADLLGMYLLRNAGYDPRIAVTFWRAHGGEVGGGFFRSRTHPSATKRAAAIEAEIARIPAGAGVPYVPPLVATRGEGLR
jgi:hypothetical protein